MSLCRWETGPRTSGKCQRFLCICESSPRLPVCTAAGLRPLWGRRGPGPSPSGIILLSVGQEGGSRFPWARSWSAGEVVSRQNLWTAPPACEPLSQALSGFHSRPMHGGASWLACAGSMTARWLGVNQHEQGRAYPLPTWPLCGGQSHLRNSRSCSWGSWDCLQTLLLLPSPRCPRATSLRWTHSRPFTSGPESKREAGFGIDEGRGLLRTGSVQVS